MGYRELSRMEMYDVVRRWQAGQTQRQIARSTGLARATLSKYLRAAVALGLSAQGPPPTEEQLVQLVRAGRAATAPRTWTTPQADQLAPDRDRIARWLSEEHLQLTRVHELLGRPVSYSTLERTVWRWGLRARRTDRATVRLAPTAPGEVAAMDFEKLGVLLDPDDGRRHVIWGLSVVLLYSRHSFLWLLEHQTLEATLGGLEHAWRFFGGVPQRLILDNFSAAIAGPDRYEPRPTRSFLDDSQARGFLIDPARVRHPKDKPHVERGVQYARERFWKGGTFHDLADARQQAEAWCREVAGQRVHGTTRRVPLVVFEEEERAHLLPYDGVPYDVPVWREVTVHPDHHVSLLYALYSLPSTTCPPGTKLEARVDRDLVRLYHRGALVKTHPRQPKGGRSTDPADYPQELTAYALRAPEQIVRRAEALGPGMGHFAARLLAGPLPWAKLRQGQKLLRLAEKYTPVRLDAACERALAFDLVDVRRLERIVLLALEHEADPAPPLDGRLVSLPVPRYARTGAAFDHRYPLSAAPTERLWSEEQP